MENETANTPTEDSATAGQQPKAAAATSNLSATETVDIPIGASHDDDEEEKKEETKESTSDIEETKTAATSASDNASDNNLSA